MKSRQLIRSRRAEETPSGRAPRTGEHCPVSGWWSPAGRPFLARFIQEGNIMPVDGETPVRWVPAPLADPRDLAQR